MAASEQRKQAEAIALAALRAVDPAPAVRAALAQAPLPPRPTLLLAVGKAAPAMALAATASHAFPLCGALVITARGHTAGFAFPAGWQVYEAGHPLPDADGETAARQVELALRLAPAEAQLLLLLSGGASALLPAPAPGLTLADVQAVTQALLRCGATIHEINTVRKHLERLKGGGLARLWGARPLRALVLADVVGEDLAVIGSGPVTPDPTTFAEAWAVLESYALLEQVPPAVLDYLQRGRRGEVSETPKADAACFAQVAVEIVAANRHAVQAAAQAAQALGYTPLVLGAHLEGEAREVGRAVAGLARSVLHLGWPTSPPLALIWGGETTVTVRGSGRGGRNQELALAAAIALAGLEGVGLLAFSTDGRDGPTDAAGAFVDGTTWARLRQAGIDPRRALADNNSYTALDAVGALFRTGPTGTNVNDLIILLIDRPSSLHPPYG